MTTTNKKTTITHSASGASCTIHDYGATVVSFKTGAGRECLFLSREAKLDDTKAIRGGIPLVFPQFGQPDPSMPQHGFLRNNLWMAQPESVYDQENSAGITYSLAFSSDVKEAKGGKWNETTELNCTCEYNIQIEASKMTTTLEIKNTTASTQAFDFQTLQHTYYMVDEHAAYDTSQCYVKGLEGYALHDKITDTKSTCGGDPVILEELTDRVYAPPPGKDVVDITVGVGGGQTIHMTATGTVDGTSVPVSCVVWNPWKENAAAMTDFGDDQVSSPDLFIQEIIVLAPQL
jgi:glucose-6-phosphate 1-epimerase